MTTPGATATNVADGAATVGVQAGTVHEVTIYQVAANDPPEKKYRAGVRYLDGGMPRKARQLIDEAIVAGHATSEVWFHWLLALLSDRNLREFPKEDLSRLRAVQRQLPLDDDNEWADGVRLILRLFDSLKAPDADLHLVLKELDALGTAQRDKVLRHLDLILEGPLEDQLWKRTIDRVRDEGTAGNRMDRVWMFFQPKPARPRVRQPTPVATTLAHQIRATVASILFVAAAGYIGWLLTQRGEAFALLAGLVSIAGGYTCARHGLEWRFRVERLRAKDGEHFAPRQRVGHTPPDGFAKQVDKLFHRYFARYVPDGIDRSVWLTDTAGIRRTLRDEVVEIYRESRAGAEAIVWLIRYQVSEVKRHWLAGTLLAYRSQLRTRATTKLAFVLGLAALVGGGVWGIAGAVRERPLGGAASALLVIASGLVAAKGWLRIVLERRRIAADQAESDQRLKERMAAYQRWCDKLARKPNDSEMAAWLDCDRKLLMDWAMRHYGLAASAVIAHAFLEAPAPTNKRARVRNGPWRYSKYRLLVFLLTKDGVRQVSADLDFEKALFHDWHRTNYRFDAVAAVQVTESGGHPRTFELTLVNGQSIDVLVTESGAEQLQQGEDPRALSSVALDASGLTNTLHVLEGIAAEGKEWIRHEIQRGEGRIMALTSAVQAPTD